MKTIAVANQKGGVGKSTTCYHLARAAYLDGKRVLVVDLDPQGNITSSFAHDPVAHDTAGLADVLSQRAPETIRDVIVSGLWEDVDLVPTVGETLSYVRDELVVAGAGRETRLRKALKEVENDYDLCLLDCPPAIDQLTLNGLTAAQEVLIVTQSKQWSMNGLAHLIENIERVRESYNPTLKIAGLIVNLHESKTLTGSKWISELNEYATSANIPILHPPVPKRVAIGDSVESSYALDQWPTPDANELAKIYSRYYETLQGEHE